MTLNLFRLVETVRSSYWFIPSLMVAAAILAGLFMVWLDARIGTDWLDDLGWYYSARPEGAHEVLSTIAGSMITVAGVVFSITIVAVSFAAGQYGPRILSNFMADRGNQVTLGTFIATFVYCLVVLRTIRVGDETAFVPELALTLGMALALASIAVLIYFIHHVPQSIHVNTLVAHIGRQLEAAVARDFPDACGDSRPPVPAVPPPGPPAAIRARRTGYIQAIDEDGLAALADEQGFTLRLRYRPGDFLLTGRTLADLWPAEGDCEEIAERACRRIATGSRRSPSGDLRFLIDELVEIAARALSTGVNDPFTAISCLDWLAAGASRAAGRRGPGAASPRLLIYRMTFADFIAQSFGQARQYVARDMNTAIHMLVTLGEIAKSCGEGDRIAALRDEADRMLEMSEAALNGPALEAVRARHARLIGLLGETDVEAASADWADGCY